MRRLAWLAALLLVPSAAAASLEQSFADPVGDAHPNVDAIDIVFVHGVLDDTRLTVDLKLAGPVAPEGVTYQCVADLNPSLPAFPHYELTFGDNHFSSKYRFGDSSLYTLSTEGAAWSEQGVHFSAKRGETNAVSDWSLTCSTRKSPEGTGDFAAKDSGLAPVAKKAKGFAPALDAAALLAVVCGLTTLRFRRT